MADERENTANAPEQDINEMMRVRREKMDAFRALLRLDIALKSRIMRRISRKNMTILPKIKKEQRCASQVV